MAKHDTPFRVDVGGRGDVEQGLIRGLHSTGSLLSRTSEAAARGLGAEDTAQYFSDIADTQRRKSEQFPAAIPRVEDIGNRQGIVSDAIDWAQGGLAELASQYAPNIAGSIAGAKLGGSLPIPHPGLKAAAGLAGGAVGAFLPSFGVNYGETYEQQKELGDNDPGKALPVGLAKAGLDVIMPGRIGAGLVKDVAKRGYKEAAKRGAIGFAQGVPLEAATEAEQTWLDLGHKQRIDPAFDPYSDEAKSELINAAALGGLGGGVASGVGGAAQGVLAGPLARAANKGQPTDIPEQPVVADIPESAPDAPPEPPVFTDIPDEAASVMNVDSQGNVTPAEETTVNGTRKEVRKKRREIKILTKALSQAMPEQQALIQDEIGALQSEIVQLEGKDVTEKQQDEDTGTGTPITGFRATSESIAGLDASRAANDVSDVTGIAGQTGRLSEGGDEGLARESLEDIDVVETKERVEQPPSELEIQDRGTGKPEAETGDEVLAGRLPEVQEVGQGEEGVDAKEPPKSQQTATPAPQTPLPLTTPTGEELLAQETASDSVPDVIPPPDVIPHITPEQAEEVRAYPKEKLNSNYIKGRFQITPKQAQEVLDAVTAKSETTVSQEIESLVGGQEKSKPVTANTEKQPWEMTRDEFITYEKQLWEQSGLNEDEFNQLLPSLSNEHYNAIEKQAKSGKKIKKAVIDSLEGGAKYTFIKKFGEQGIDDDGAKERERKRLSKEINEKLDLQNNLLKEVESSKQLKEARRKLDDIEEEIQQAKRDVVSGRPTSYKLTEEEKNNIVENKRKKLALAIEKKQQLLKDYPDLKRQNQAEVLSPKEQQNNIDVSKTPDSYVQAKKLPNGKYQLFFTGTRNEVFPGELFKSAREARQYFRAIKAKQNEAQQKTSKAKETNAPEKAGKEAVDKPTQFSKTTEPLTNPLPQPQITRAVNRLLKQMKGLPIEHHIHATQDASPFSGEPGRVEAAITVKEDGTYRLDVIAGNIGSREALNAALAEEIIGHAGLRNLMGDKHAGLLKLVQQAATKDNGFKKAWETLSGRTVDGKVLNKKAAYYGKDDAVIADEVISKLAREGNNSNWMKRVYSRIMAFLRDIGLVKGKLTRAEAEGLLERAFLKGQQEPLSLDATQTEPLFSFAGQSGKTSNPLSLAKAVQMDEDGNSSEDIRKDTGWLKGFDDKWRFEISDDEAYIKDRLAQNLGEMLDHKSIYKAYPELSQVKIFKHSGLGSYVTMNENSPFDSTITLRDNFTLSDLLHEVQHIIQIRENFHSGGNPSDIRNKIKSSVSPKIDALETAYRESADKFKKISQEWHKPGTKESQNWREKLNNAKIERQQAMNNLQDANDRANGRGVYSNEAYNIYKRLAGEVEARNTQTRQPLTKEERITITPESTQDVPSNNVISDNTLFSKAQDEGYQGDDKAEAKEWLNAKEKGLPMDKASRMKRAKAMGFDVDTVYYYGTQGDISEFKESRIGKGSTIFGNYDVERHGIFVTPDIDIATEFANQGEKPSNQNIMPLLISLKNPINMFDGEYTNDLFDKVEKWAENKGMRGYAVARELGDYWGGDNAWEMFDENTFMQPQEWIMMFRDLGFDSAIIYEPSQEHNDVSGKTFVLFNPNQIRSIHAAFDPDKADSGNILYSKKGESVWAEMPEAPEDIKRAYNKSSSFIKAQVFGALTLRQIADVSKKVLPMIKDNFMRDTQLMQTELNKRLSFAGKIATDWAEKLDKTQSETLAKLMHDSTIEGVDGAEDYVSVIDLETVNQKISVIRQKMREQPDKDNSSLKKEIKEIRSLEEFEKKRKQAYPGLKRRFNALPKDAKDIYIRSRDYHTRHFAEVLEALNNRINESKASIKVKKELISKLRLKFESVKIASPYFPLSRFGDFWVSSEENGESRFDMFESEGDQLDFIKQLEASPNMEVVGAGKKLKNLNKLDGVSTEFIGEVDQLIGQLGDDPIVDELRDNVYQLYLKTLPELSARKHFIHRKKTKGYHEDQLRAFAYKAEHDSHQIAKLKYSHKLAETLNKAKDALKIASSKRKMEQIETENEWLDEYIKGNLTKEQIDKEIADIADEETDAQEKWLQFKRWSKSLSKADASAKMDYNFKLIEAAKTIQSQKNGVRFAADALNEIRLSYQAMMNSNTHWVAQLLNSIGFGMYLGLTPAAALVNTMQTPVVALPMLASKVGWKQASKSMLEATKMFFANSSEGFKNFTVATELKTKNEKEAFQRWVDEGLIDVTLAHDLSGLSAEGALRNTTKHKLMTSLSFMFHHAERANREITALAAYRAAKETGKLHLEAMQLAESLVWTTHFDYSSLNRARFMRGNAARVITQFKQYSQNITYLYGRAFHQAFINGTEQEKAEARKALRGLLIAQFSVAGTLGMPVVGAAMAIAQGIKDVFGDDDEPEDYKAMYRQFMADTFGKTKGQIISKGFIDTFTPLSVSSRLSVSDLWIRESEMDLEGRSEAYDWMKTILGPTASLFENGFVAKQLFADGHYERGMEVMMPKVLKDSMKAYRYATEGAENLRGDKLKADFNSFELVGQALGFSSSEISELYEKNNAVNRLASSLGNRRQRLLDGIANARIDKDSEKADRLRREIAEFNRKNKDNPITAKSIRLSIRARLRRSSHVESGLYVSKRNKRFVESLDF